MNHSNIDMKYAVFVIQCPDQKGLVSRISTFFYKKGFNILHCQQHTDIAQNQYFMRLKLDLGCLSSSRKDLERSFEEFGRPLNLEWSVHYSDHIQRIAILVTKSSHCLYDLLLRQQGGEVSCEIPIIISNHPDLDYVADIFRIPFECFPLNHENKCRQELEVRRVLKQHHIDLVVLARYMQILSEEFVKEYEQRVINIHHAFLPAFKGANPYQQASDRGVKMIGATAHYVTADLDGGPVIEQDVQSVTHEHSVEDLKQIGGDIERNVLARAVKAHLENRTIVSNGRTIVFSTGV
ncbi:MAG: formyltetrahydrofolate deformylase [Ignavibacteria bacterium]|nr:formyltetrahydrofolate deformylase [Ignavibacteria bacterium]